MVLELLGALILTPLLLPVLMIIIGGLTSLIAPYMAWMPRLGLYLLIQKWWWFPVGPLVGLIVYLSEVLE